MRNICLMCDSMSQGTAWAEALTKKGCNVTLGLCNKTTIMKSIHNYVFDIIVVDASLGNFHQVIKEIRTKVGDECPIIALTSAELPGDRKKFIEAGGTRLLVKPFTISYFITCLLQCLPKEVKSAESLEVEEEKVVKKLGKKAAEKKAAEKKANDKKPLGKTAAAKLAAAQKALEKKSTGKIKVMVSATTDDAGFFAERPVVDASFALKKLAYERKTMLMLNSLDIPSNVKGYDYVKTAIALCFLDKRMSKNVTKLLYPYIADEYGTESVAVERSIRNIITREFKPGHNPALEACFKNLSDRTKKKPTNTEFICTMLNIMELNGDFIL